jgi:hypothetical protein
MKRARGVSDGEIVDWNESKDNVREEVLRRNAKAGYCTKNGEPCRATKIQNSIPFGKQKLNVWKRDENGNLID